MSAFYNENDPKAAAWLRELINHGHIAPGVVDERSISDLRPHDLAGFTQCHFFAGIGGWSLALRLAGWPDDLPAWTGSCPCQPFSQAGRGKVDKDERHLWPAFRSLIAECGPSVCFGEQVASADGRIWLAGVRADLEGMGYAVGAADLCAAGVGAPHIRQRLYWVADAQGQRRGGRGVLQIRSEARNPWSGHGSSLGSLADVRGAGLEGRHARTVGDERPTVERGCAAGGMGFPDGTGRNPGEPAPAPPGYGRPAFPTGGWGDFDLIPCTDGKARRVEPGTFPLAHGVSGRVGLLRGYGNAIVPAVAAEFVGAWLDVAGLGESEVRP